MFLRSKMAKGIATTVAVVVITAVVAANADQKEKDRASPKEVTVTGKIVDLHTFMTGKCRSDDHARCMRACIQAGVPAAIEAEGGLIIVGQGERGPQRTLARLASQTVELKGKLYERGGLRYVDLTAVRPVKEAEPTDEDLIPPKPFMPERDEDEPEAEEDEPEPESARGACCLPGGDCIDTTSEECAEQDGDFYAGLDCGEVDCD